MKSYLLLLVLALLPLMGCSSAIVTARYDCSHSTGKRVYSADEAIQVAAKYLDQVGVNEYLVESGKASLTDSTYYEVIFKKSVDVLPPNEILWVRASDGCTWHPQLE